MEKVLSYVDFAEKVNDKDKSFLLLYKSGSEQSDCAFRGMDAALGGERELAAYTADVTSVRDIHSRYGITTVPALLVFEQGSLVSVIKGCQGADYYKALAQNAIFQAKAKAEGKKLKQVTVYSTPVCPWCNTLKSWLRRHHVPFTDVDVSRDEHAAEELVRRTGQQGVPQTDIEGQFVVGFNEARLKQLLEI